MKRAVASLLLVALLGLKTVAVVHGQFLTIGPTWSFDASDEIDPDKFIVGYNNKEGRDMALSNATTVRRELINLNVVAVTMTSNKAEALRRNKNIKYIEPDLKRYLIGVRGGGTNSVPTSPNLRRLVETSPYGIGMVQANLLSFNTTSNITVCIIDTGYGLGHEDLPDNATVTGAPNGGFGPWYEDGDGHGTHVAGTIAAIGNNAKGVIGVCPGVKLHIVRVFGNGKGTYSSDILAALNACKTAGAKIVSMSLGGTGSSITEETAYNNANNEGVLTIAAAGNSGNTAFSYPASYTSVVSVGAVDESKIIASFSQKNSQVDFAAPGVRVQSTVPGSNYAFYSGTSMATPHVSGVAALVWSRFPACTNQNIRDALAFTAQDLGTTGLDNSYGFGLVQAKNAFDCLLSKGCGACKSQGSIACTAAGKTCSAVAPNCCTGTTCKLRRGLYTCRV
jgi:serine protease